MAYSFDDNTLSDLYKVAYGFRPGAAYCETWKSFTDDEKEKEWTRLCQKMEDVTREEKEDEERNLVAFEEQIKNIIALGATSREQAIKWIVDSLDCSSCWDAGYVCYRLGLSYSVSKQFEPFVKGPRE